MKRNDNNTLWWLKCRKSRSSLNVLFVSLGFPNTFTIFLIATTSPVYISFPELEKRLKYHYNFYHYQTSP